MSRHLTKSKGIKLPHSLQQELGLHVQARGSGGRRRNGLPGNRKQQRKAGRIEKRAARSSGSRRTPRETVAQDGIDDALKEGSSESDVVTQIKAPMKTRRKNPLPKVAEPPYLKLKSILKRPEPRQALDELEETSSSREPSPGLHVDITSRAYKDRAALDEADILALEKKLGVGKKKGSNSLDDDIFEDLLGGFESEDERSKRKREADEWLQRKRRKPVAEVESAEEESDEKDLDSSDGSEDGISDLREDEDGLLVEDIESIGENEASDFSGIGSDNDEDSEIPKPRRIRENPYVAPVAAGVSVGKYIPPSLRKQTKEDSESLTKLRRQIQGHLNKLSEANLVTILNEVEKIYQSNARQDVTSTLNDLLLSLFCDRSSLQSTFAILHAAFIAGIYKIIGTDFGAEIIANLVERFGRFYSAKSPTASKETVNLVSLLSQLYTFHVINSTLVFDYIRIFLQEVSESNTELVLKVVRDCGPQLRQDDPSSLRSIVQIMQSSTAKLSADGQETSVRTKFMIEIITDLKNNKMKAAIKSSGMAIEHITQMRKVLGSLNSRNLRASEPLRISLRDIEDSDKTGKWWLVGASWKGNEAELADVSTEGNLNDKEDDYESPESDLLELARQYRMNTDVRRSIFVAIMSASDWQDAYVRLMKLRLKRSQEQEIPKVLLRCAGAETAHNPYYTLITKKLCSDKRLKMAFQFVLWDFFKRMGERGDLEDADDIEEDEGVELTEIVNLAKMYGCLIADGALSIGILKTLNLVYLKDQAKMFVELLLIGVLTESSPAKQQGVDERKLSNVFSRATETPQVIQGLQYFLKKYIRHSDLVSEKEMAAVKKGCRTASSVLSRIATS